MEQFQILRVSKLKIKTHTQNNNKILNIALEKLHTTAAKSKSSRSQELLFRKTSRSQELLMAIPKSERDWNGVVRVSEWSREDRERRVAVAGDGASPPVESPPPESERRRDGLPLPEGDGVSLQTGPTCQCPPQPSSRFSLSPSLSYGFYGFTPPLSSLSLSPLRRPPPPPPATAAAFARAQSPEATAARSELSRLGRPLCLARAPPILPREIIRWFSSNSHTVFVGGFRLGFAGSDYKCSCASCVKLEAPFRLKISAVLLLIVIKLVRFCCLRNAKITLRIAFPSGNNNLFLCKQEKCTITH